MGIAAKQPVPSIAFDPGEDFRKTVYERIGHLIDDVEIFHSQILVAKFMRTKHSANIIATANSEREDRYQGKVGLVLKVGPGAFQDNPGTGDYFHGVSVKPGDWVHYRYSDGADFNIRPSGSDANKVECRLLEDSSIKGRLSRPDLIW